MSREFSPVFSVGRFFQVDYACMFSGLRANSLEPRAGNFSTRSREFYARSREEQLQLWELRKSAMSTSPVRPSGPKRVLDIERALSWAYREELPKRQRRLAFENAVDRPRMQPSPLARMMALATPIDSWSRHPENPAGNFLRFGPKWRFLALN